jgi:hypothetical protein
VAAPASRDPSPRGTGALWQHGTEQEQRVLIDELLEGVEVHVDHLEVIVRGAPRLNVTLEEVGLKGSAENRSCRRGDLNPHALAGTSPSRFSGPSNG